MRSIDKLDPLLRTFTRVASVSLITLLLGGCDGGDNGSVGAAGPAGPSGAQPTDTNLSIGEPSPGVNFGIVGLSGATGPEAATAAFLPGDTISVTYTMTKDDGSAWFPSEMNRMRALVSGPTFNYQRIIAETSDPLSMSVDNGDGTYTFTFETPIPDNYLPPVNDTTSFGIDDGELSGTPLLDGTYTVGIYGRWEYEVGGSTIRDVGDATVDFLIGQAAGPLTTRAVSDLASCNECHGVLQAHGGQRQNLTICLMCHTAGSEDKNVASAANGTPGVSVDFRVMIHRIHNGAHLPSVLGVATTDAVSGTRDYTAVPKPYEIVGYNNYVHNFSSILFPTWPSLNYGTLRDEGYSGLSSTAQDLEDDIRTGVIACDKCHGDPDGDGPLGGPANGALAYQQPSRAACGSCHDDWDWDLPYKANGFTMAAQTSDSGCTTAGCHTESGTSLSVRDAHIHPMHDPQYMTGVIFDITSVDEVSAAPDGNIDPGDKVAATFTIRQWDGADVDPSGLSSTNLILSGPTDNMQFVHYNGWPTAALTGPQPYTMMLPEARYYEYLGDSSASNGDTFFTPAKPLWDDKGAATVAYLVIGLGDGASTLVSATAPPANYIDVVDGSNFAHNELLVIDEGVVGFEEYLRIQHVDGNRIWFSSPYTGGYAVGPRVAHSAGAVVDEVLLPLDDDGDLVPIDPGDYMLDQLNGVITETAEFGAGRAVIVSYTTDFVMPTSYPLPLNGSPDFGETWGTWSGMSVVDGTYRLSIYGRKSVTVNKWSESNSYRDLSQDPAYEFLVGDSITSLQPYDLIATGAACYKCHGELGFHGYGRGGYDTCLACHGTAGAEDRPQYVAANATATTRVGVDFRAMIHKIHMGKELTYASTYVVNGYGYSYPNNFTPHMYDKVEFPVMSVGAMDCAQCHGSADAWTDPGDRSHPTEQVMPAREWRVVCNSCHDSSDEVAHTDVMTTGLGAESCGVCHGPGKELAVDVVHMIR